MNRLTIRSYAPGDEYAMAQVIRQTLLASNSGDYPPAFIQKNIEEHSPAILARRAKGTQHMYVACDGDTVIGCGGIDGYWGSQTESYLMSIFVLPAYQKRGIGRKIVQALEADAYFRRAWRTEVGSSLTAVHFYEKMGYEYKNGVTVPDQDGVVRLEKRKGAGDQST